MRASCMRQRTPPATIGPHVREVAAKREILAMHQLRSLEGGWKVCACCRPVASDDELDLWPCATVRALAAVYGDDDT